MLQRKLYSAQKKKVNNPGFVNFPCNSGIILFAKVVYNGAKKNLPLSTGKTYFAPSGPLSFFFLNTVLQYKLQNYLFVTLKYTCYTRC